MHRFILAMAAAVAVGGLSSRAAPSDDSGAASAKKLRLGVYDNRAIAVAYAASKYNPVQERMEQYQKAKDAGDNKRVAELEAWGEKHQRQLHRQGFGRVPVDDLLAHIKDKLPAVAKAADVRAIVWQCDFVGADIEMVDISDQLVQLFDPTERTLRTVEQLRAQKPIDLDEIEKHHKHEGPAKAVHPEQPRAEEEPVR